MRRKRVALERAVRRRVVRGEIRAAGVDVVEEHDPVLVIERGCDKPPHVLVRSRSRARTASAGRSGRPRAGRCSSSERSRSGDRSAPLVPAAQGQPRHAAARPTCILRSSSSERLGRNGTESGFRVGGFRLDVQLRAFEVRPTFPRRCFRSATAKGRGRPAPGRAPFGCRGRPDHESGSPTPRARARRLC